MAARARCQSARAGGILSAGFDGVCGSPLELLVNIDVGSLDDAVAFYTEGLGLRLKRRLFENTVAELDGVGCPILLLEKAAGSPIGPGASQARTYARHWTAVHLDFAVAALEPAVERAVRAGARLEAGIQ